MNEPENQPINRNSHGGFASGALFVWDFLKIVLIALVIIVPIRYYIFKPYVVSGSSMEPNFHNGQYLIVDELTYRAGDPDRGDVIVLHYPRDPKQDFIKRIVGLPGEKIKIENGQVTIINADHPEGVTLNEKYLPNQGLTYEQDPIIVGGSKVLTLNKDEYFVLGDNRQGSSDSRTWGILPRKYIVGRVFIRVLPLKEFDFFTKAPAYGF
ncbi:MAG: signal peptidase I [Candidatus Doudnabacteria bacterium]|nr:signal peptidase I [Candidatus Doudnabacteria bacterium]